MGSAFSDPIAGIIEELRYGSYRFNRQNAPDITPASWKVLLGPDVDVWEKRYQKEITNGYADAKIRQLKEVPEWERNARTGGRES